MLSVFLSLQFLHVNIFTPASVQVAALVTTPSSYAWPVALITSVVITSPQSLHVIVCSPSSVQVAGIIVSSVFLCVHSVLLIRLSKPMSSRNNSPFRSINCAPEIAPPSIELHIFCISSSSITEDEPIVLVNTYVVSFNTNSDGLNTFVVAFKLFLLAKFT